MSPLVNGKTDATMTGQRWCVRILSLSYYFVIAPFLYDLFANGTRWRSAYLFPYILLSVSGLQIGFKESDTWVRAWYWLNLVFVAFITVLAFFYAPFGVIASLYPWEKWIHFGILIACVLFFPLHFFLKRRAMANLEDWDAEVEIEDAPLPRQTKQPVQPPAPEPAPAPAPVPAPTPVPPPEEPPAETPVDPGLLG